MSLASSSLNLSLLPLFLSVHTHTLIPSSSTLFPSMDITKLSSKPQTLTLTSSLSLSPSSSSSSSSYKFCTIQREFLGSYNHRLLRPQLGLLLPYRKKFKKPMIHSSKFVFRASLDSQAIVVFVAVAAISALTVLYFKYINARRSKENEKKHSGAEDAESVESIEVLKELKGVQKQAGEGQTSELVDTNVGVHMIERSSIAEKHSVNIKGFQKQGVLHKNIGSNHRENVVIEASDLSGFDVLSSNTSVSVSTQELEEVPGGAEFGFKSHHALVVHVNEEMKEVHKPDHVVGEASNLQIPGYRGFLKESAREELFTFYEENQSRNRSVSDLMDLKSASPHCDRRRSTLSSLLRSNTVNGSELSANRSHHSSGLVSLERQMALAQSKDGSSSKMEEGWVLPRDTGKEIAAQNNQSGWHESPPLKGRHANIQDNEPKYLSNYNRLLRAGRLSDCIELLKSMDRKGLLDMDKIYHVKFFNICKSQKAVKEAFCFAELIGNPTLSTFNMLLSVCASSQDSEGTFQVLHMVKEAGMKADCKLYTTLISSCAKSGKVDTMFKVFHEMVNAGVEPNLHTYGALIDGCARAGQVAKAFGAYGILRSKNVKPDRVVFNALITACGQSGAVDRAFDVLAEMKAEPTPVDPDHVTVGALIKTCTQAGQFDRVHEVYKMIHQYNIKGTPEVYTIAIRSCSQLGDLEFALGVYRDMTRNGVVPDEMFLSALVDVAGHAGKVDVAFEVLQEARTRGIELGNITYSSLMGACSNAKNWQKALELYEDIKSFKLTPTVSTLNALVTALCDGDQLQKAVEVLDEMKKRSVSPNIITYSILIVASEKKDEVEVGLMLYSQAKNEGVIPNLIICKCLIGMCLRRFEKAYSLGDPVFSLKSGNPQVDNKWTSLALTVYRETIASGVLPTMEVFSSLLGCLQFPCDTSSRTRLVENLGVSSDASVCSNLCSLIEGFGEYDPRSFSLLEEATSLCILPCVSFKACPIIVDARKLQIHTAEVYLLTILKGLKHRLAAGARLPNINIVLPVEKTQVLTPKGEKTIKLAGRVGQSIGALLRRLGLPYQGNESYGKIRINGISVKRWFQPKLASPHSGKPPEFNSELRLGKGISGQQRDIRMRNLYLDVRGDDQE
ncbi:hypothetical protein IFM89_004811 [Coptis chinensis]|uniref:PROP1-like PPR domain-containing protein n=1 Tax=Coptis chinensis TaxID=261450 RepID=A0A835ITU2_9MAGN|nr:hypothetical protein IFM89_004811 [Coptis chinensis]